MEEISGVWTLTSIGCADAKKTGSRYDIGVDDCSPVAHQCQDAGLYLLVNLDVVVFGVRGPTCGLVNVEGKMISVINLEEVTTTVESCGGNEVTSSGDLKCSIAIEAASAHSLFVGG
ncbi:UNVERIFIED_CONTAM: hypothetical protein K2H54_047959 [Gekko kuhli]